MGPRTHRARLLQSEHHVGLVAEVGLQLLDARLELALPRPVGALRLDLPAQPRVRCRHRLHLEFLKSKGKAVKTEQLFGFIFYKCQDCLCFPLTY